MAGMEPGDRPGPSTSRGSRQLDRAPGERYAPTGSGGRDGAGGALFAPLAKAVIAALLGAVLLYALGALLSSSVGLVFVAGLAGAAVGLLLARAAVPSVEASAALTRRQAMWLAVAIAVLAVVVGSVGTWLHALAEGGALGFVDYQLETFGAIVPLEVLAAAVTAAWGATAGPVQA